MPIFKIIEKTKKHYLTLGMIDKLLELREVEKLLIKKANKKKSKAVSS